MSRDLTSRRFPMFNGSQDIRWIIKQKPLMVTVHRHSGSSRSEASDTVVATFEARIDLWRNRQRDWQDNTATYATEINYLLTTYCSVDPFGNTVTFEPGDTLVADGVTYMIGAKFTEPNVKQEAVLILVQP